LLKFFPAWLHTWEAKAQLGAIHLLADTLQACEAFMLRGEAEFLLYHHHPAAPSRLGLDQFQSVQVGDDRLVPVGRSESGWPTPLRSAWSTWLGAPSPGLRLGIRSDES
jgi:hypothetical protein